jgi:hypothetical protein
MSHISSISSSSYAFHGTLSRLDTNGDGVLSQEEIQASERPGILGEDGDDSTNSGSGNSQAALSNIIALLIQSAPNGKQEAYGAATPGSSATDSGLEIASDAYRGTYGQYDVSTMAA